MGDELELELYAAAHTAEIDPSPSGGSEEERKTEIGEEEDVGKFSG